VTGSCAGVRVVVVAVDEVGALIHQEPETTFAKTIVVALQIIAAELIDDDDDDQLGTILIGGAEG